MSSTASNTTRPASARRADLIKLAIGAGIFAIGIGMAATYCAACEHPATIATDNAR